MCCDLVKNCACGHFHVFMTKVLSLFLLWLVIEAKCMKNLETKEPYRARFCALVFTSVDCYHF